MGMTTRDKTKYLGYPVDKYGGPEKFDDDNLPTAEEASRKYPAGHWDEQMAKARELGEKIRRERAALLARLHVLPTDPRRMN